MDIPAAATGAVTVTQILSVAGGTEIAFAALGKPVGKHIEYDRVQN